MLDGVTVVDMVGNPALMIDPYAFEIEPNVFIEIEDFADVVTRWHSFRPCDGEPNAHQNAMKSFFWSHQDAGMAYIEAAEDNGLHAIMPLPFIGNLSNHCGGSVIDDDPDQLWSNQMDPVRIPLANPDYGAAKDLITPDFIDYWVEKAAEYVDSVDAYDDEDVVWRWRVIEELRHWVTDEYAFALAVRDVVNTYDGTRRMVEYTAGHYLPDGSIMYTLLEKDAPIGSNEFDLDPADPVARLADGNGDIDPLYPATIAVERDMGDYLEPLFDDVLTGGYTGHYLWSHAYHNRIHPYHRIRLGREVLDNIDYVYSTNSAAKSISQDPPGHILFHAPDLTQGGAYYMTADHARHDFWAGIHEARGVWIYSMSYRDFSAYHEVVWEEYVRALYLIKSEMRPYLTDGVKTTPPLSHTGTQTVPYDYYMDIGPFANADFLALPDDPEYSTINHSLFTVDDVGYLIVTNSWNDEAVFDVEFTDCIDTADIVSGSSANLVTAGKVLDDTFEGIDARVYEITFEACP